MQIRKLFDQMILNIHSAQKFHKYTFSPRKRKANLLQLKGKQLLSYQAYKLDVLEPMWDQLEAGLPETQERAHCFLQVGRNYAVPPLADRLTIGQPPSSGGEQGSFCNIPSPQVNFQGQSDFVIRHKMAKQQIISSMIRCILTHLARIIISSYATAIN